MRKILLMMIITVCALTNSYAQQVPAGMKYQAVARNSSGEVLADRSITLRIDLKADASKGTVIYYSEEHAVTTNKFGLFDLVVGEGKNVSGTFADIPWSSENIWMAVSLKEKGADFAAITESKLLAVPYAFYAASAGEVAGKILTGSTAKGETSKCPCKGGLSQIKVLYLGPNSVTVKVYRKKELTELLTTFTGVNNGQILTVNAVNFPDGKLKDVTYFQVLSPGIPVVEIPTECEELKEPWEMSLGETFGNFSVLSHLDRENGAECTVCDIKKEWHVGGNGLMDLCNWLGTKSNTDLIIITNNIERLRIKKDGDIDIKRNLTIGGSLTVDSSVLLNRIAGATLNHGNLTVDGATDLNTSLNVDGPTDLQSRLNVNNASPTRLTGTLRVDGITDLNAALNVNNMSPTLLTGMLRVNKPALFKDSVFLDDAGHQSTSTTNGALVVAGGLGLGGNLNVGGKSAFGGPVTFGAAVTITDLTQSVSTTTGALIVSGGVGIARRLNVGDSATFLKPVIITSTAQSLLINDGALVVAGGAGITKNLNVGGTLTTAGVTTINNTLNVTGSGSYIANFVNTANANGITIKVGAATPAHANNFVSFLDNSGSTVGRIEGETLSELVNNDDYKVEIKSLDLAVTLSGIDVATGAIGVIMAGIDLVGAATSSTACAGLGVCVTAPVPSLIIAATINLATAIANEVAVSFGLDDAITQRDYFVSTAAGNVGVTYQSGSGDYAEWLPKADLSEKFMPGYIAGIKDGHISLKTAGADKLFVISTKPIVLGNMPEQGKESGYEKVAFMGQVPVHIIGKVNAGDYILPSGHNDGFAVAVSPSKMKADDYEKVVGMAWASSNSNYSTVNVAIGLNTGDISKVVAEQSKEINTLKEQINSTNSILAKLIPGYKEAAGLKSTDVLPITMSPVKTSGPTPIARTANNLVPANISVPDVNNIIYFEISDKQVTDGFEVARKMFLEQGGNENTHPFWKRMKDAAYKASVVTYAKAKIQSSFHIHQDINDKVQGAK